MRDRARDSQELLELERLLLQPEVRKDRTRMAGLLSPDFLEISASGKRYDRERVILDLQSEKPAHSSLADGDVRWLSDDIALLTYRVTRRQPDTASERASLRSSIWRRTEDGWVLEFHQGTPTEV